MAPKALITGATGLLGRQVVKAFSAGYDVVGAGFSRASPPQILKVDIQDTGEVEKLFKEVKYGARHFSRLPANLTDPT
jgi:S-adenosylmethionine synthetase